MSGIDKAIKIAVKAHAGVKDIDGKPYILHSLAVGLMGNTDSEIICGFLHDVVKKSDITLNDLALSGFSTDIIDTLRLLTHSSTVPYMDYIKNLCISGNKTAIAVKLNDLRHNIERERIDKDRALIDKHAKALEYLEAFNGEQRAIHENIDFQRIENQLKNLRVARQKGKKAPHKPVLLLSVIALISSGYIEDNKIVLSSELERMFFNQWDRYVSSEVPFHAIIDTPFWHMSSEPFWSLYHLNGTIININEVKPLSASILRSDVYAKLTNSFWELLHDTKMRNALKDVLVKSIINS